MLATLKMPAKGRKERPAVSAYETAIVRTGETRDSARPVPRLGGSRRRSGKRDRASRRVAAPGFLTRRWACGQRPEAAAEPGFAGREAAAVREAGKRVGP